MWPFEKKRARVLADAKVPAAVDLVATIVSIDRFSSPLSEIRAAAIQIELFQTLSFHDHRNAVIASSGFFAGAPDETALGVVVLGDCLVLRADDGAELSVGLRRSTIGSATLPARRELRKLPPELVPLFSPVSGTGGLWVRELALSHGDRVRVRAIVAPSRAAVATEYRSAPRMAFEARDDLAPITLHRIG